MKQALLIVSAALLLFGCGQRDHHRTAIQKARKDIVTVFDSNKTNTESAEAIRYMYNNFYKGLLEVDVSECPEDFRMQFQKVIVASRELAEAAEKVPSDFTELLGYWAGQINSADPDILGGRAERNFKIKLEKMKLELGELEALSKKYI